ncbi:MBL fold metallo-hydrolase [Pseudomonas fluorescens]|uniref:MBL fold metallo-hydrolase n=1 Tax=Pseudomonas fluorescens TaxID=294 RepID=UPI0012541B85|nr:MBL fold metallo-hydrolase [Pseudomonas fluorescens]VVN43689.1 Hydroxyacylglutathione hydrolase [Pseudomonas fluorescens]
MPIKRTSTNHSIEFLTLRIAMVGIFFASGQAWAESPVLMINAEAAKSEITVISLRNDISVLEGSGGNIGVLAGKDGKFMVDSGISVSKEKIENALNKLGPSPVKFVINTHWHWDHTDGNDWLHNKGATIIATPNVVKYMSTTTRVNDWDYTFKPFPKGGIPSKTITEPTTYQFEGQTIIATPVAPGHTDGDVYVYFKTADVLFLGDLFWNGVYPFIDNDQGGSIGGMINDVNTILKVPSDNTQIVPGHGPVGTRAQLIEYRDMLTSIRDNVAKLKMQGKSLDEVIAAKPTQKFDAKWGQFVINPDFFTKLVFNGL